MYIQMKPASLQLEKHHSVNGARNCLSLLLGTHKFSQVEMFLRLTLLQVQK